MWIIFCTLMDIVSIDIAAAFVLTYINEIHLNDTIDRTIERLVFNHIAFLLEFLNILNLQGIA